MNLSMINPLQRYSMGDMLLMGKQSPGYCAWYAAIDSTYFPEWHFKPAMWSRMWRFR